SKSFNGFANCSIVPSASACIGLSTWSKGTAPQRAVRASRRTACATDSVCELNIGSAVLLQEATAAGSERSADKTGARAGALVSILNETEIREAANTFSLRFTTV